MCVCQMTLNPRFLGSCVFRTYTATAFESEQLGFHIRSGLNQNDTKFTFFGFISFQIVTGIGFDVSKNQTLM